MSGTVTNNNSQAAAAPPKAQPKQTRITKEPPSCASKVCFLIFGVGFIASACFLRHGYAFDSPEVIISLTATGAPILAMLGLMARNSYLHRNQKKKGPNTERSNTPQIIEAQGILARTQKSYSGEDHSDPAINKIPYECFRNDENTGEATATNQNPDPHLFSGNLVVAIHNLVEPHFENSNFIPSAKNQMRNVKIYYDHTGNLASLKVEIQYNLLRKDNWDLVGTMKVTANINAKDDFTQITFTKP